MIKFQCPHCGNPMKVPDDAAGRKGKCNNCDKPVIVPKLNPITVTPEVVQQAPPPAPYQPPGPPQQYTGPQPTVAVQVNQKPAAANSMGIASVILGIIAFLFCWIPFVNILSFILGGISALLAIVGLFLGISRNGSGIGYSIAGGALSAIALFFSGGFFLALFGGAAAVTQAVDAANKEMVRQQAAENAVVVNENNPARPQTAPAGMNPAKKPADKWAGKGLSATVGDVSVEIMGTDINNAQFKGIGDREPRTTEDEFLLVKLKITNNSDTKKYTYTPWKSAQIGREPLLNDEFDNTYIARDPTFQRFVGSINVEDLYPGESIEDLYVFERPVPKASKFKMHLYPRDFTKGEPVLLKFACSKELLAEAKAQSEEDRSDSEKPLMLKGAPKEDSAPIPELGRIATAGAIKAEILSAKIVPYEGEDRLAIHLRITNNSPQKHTYSTWQSKYYSSGNLLSDETGKAYETVPVKLDPKMIESMESIEDTIYFEKPDPKAKEFTLFLYPRAFTEKQPLNFKFSVNE
ncbi:hypothetical protein [Gimesia sp.]|uniref:hypothetical protein n=1 Tax=Gimesia sp. TaxID=2024833 RepID=UPI003A8DBC8B